MTAHTPETGTPAESPPSHSSSQAEPQAFRLALYSPSSSPSPLPGNRPIADNATEDINDMLGYLD